MDLNASTNSTSNDKWPQGTEAIIISVILIVIFTIALIGNFPVVFMTYWEKKLHTSTNILIANLAFCDLLITIFIIPICFIVVQVGMWPFSSITCQILGFLEMVSYTASLSSLAMISINRYYAIVRALDQDFAKKMSVKRAKYMIAIVWIYSLAWASPPLYGWNRYSFVLGKLMCNMNHREGQYPLLATIFCTLLPSTILFYCTIRIIVYMWQNFTNRSINLTRSNRLERRVTIMMGIIAIVYFLCIGPNLLMATVVRFNEYSGSLHLYYRIQAIATILYFSNSAWNSIIYGAMNSYLRRIVQQKLLTNICCRCRSDRHSSTVIPLSVRFRSKRANSQLML